MSSRARGDDDSSEEGGVPLWVVTFGDMMSLLLTFFVLLLSFSEVDAVKYRALSESLKEAFGVHRGQTIMQGSGGKEQALATQDSGSSGAILDELRSIIPQAVPGALPDRDQGDGAILNLPGGVLFDSGKADLKPGVEPVLLKIAGLLLRRPKVTLLVEGHTDNVPIHTLRFASNWELSTARAIAVIRFLMDKGGVPPSRVGAAGYADSRPLAPNDSAVNREKNRRVAFKFVELEG